MEEICKLTSRGLDEYLENEKYVQAEDLIAACNLNIVSSSSGIMCSMYEVRGIGEKPDEKSIRKDLQIIVEHIGILAHCLDLQIPELEELEEYFEDEVIMSLKMDVTMACTNINFIISNITLEYFSAEFGDDDPVDTDMLQIGIMDMITSVMAMCSRLKYNFVDVIVGG